MSDKQVTYIVGGVEVNHDGVPISELNKPTAEQSRIQELEDHIAVLTQGLDEVVKQRDAEQKRVAELEELVKQQLADDKSDKRKSH